MARTLRLYALYKRVAGTFVRCTDLAISKADAQRYWGAFVVRSALSGPDYRIGAVPDLKSRTTGVKVCRQGVVGKFRRQALKRAQVQAGVRA